MERYSIDPSPALLQSDLQSNISKNLAKHIAEVSQSKEIESADRKQVTLEVYLDQDTRAAQMKQGDKFMELEERLSKIEASLGPDALKEERYLGNNTLIKKVDGLEAKLKSLNQSQIEEAKKKMVSIVHEMEKIVSRNFVEQLQLDDVKKINYLYDKISQYEGIAAEFPLLINKFEGIKTLHEESAGL